MKQMTVLFISILASHAYADTYFSCNYKENNSSIKIQIAFSSDGKTARVLGPKNWAGPLTSSDTESEILGETTPPPGADPDSIAFATPGNLSRDYRELFVQRKILASPPQSGSIQFLSDDPIGFSGSKLLGDDAEGTIVEDPRGLTTIPCTLDYF